MNTTNDMPDSVVLQSLGFISDLKAAHRIDAEVSLQAERQAQESFDAWAQHAMAYLLAKFGVAPGQFVYCPTLQQVFAVMTLQRRHADSPGTLPALELRRITFDGERFMAMKTDADLLREGLLQKCVPLGDVRKLSMQAARLEACNVAATIGKVVL